MQIHQPFCNERKFCNEGERKRVEVGCSNDQHLEKFFKGLTVSLDDEGKVIVARILANSYIDRQVYLFIF